jgi:hypothetical protein
MALASKRKEDIKVDENFDYTTMELNTMDDYDKYNRWARRNSRPVKVPTEDSPIHKKVRVKFQRFDQPENVLKARLRSREIDWKGQLIPGKVYDLALPAVRFLNRLSTPIYQEVPVEAGSKRTETKQVGEKSRFSCQVLDFI